MQHRVTNLALVLLAIAVTATLCTPLVAATSLAKGLVMGKLFWFQGSMLLTSITALLYLAVQKRVVVGFNATDATLIGFFLVTLLTYRWEMNLAPEKMLFAGQLLVLWLLLRLVVSCNPFWHTYFRVAMLFTAVAQAVWGLMQLYGYAHSYHALFKVTGSFFNPGPYSGYMATLFPLAVWGVLTLQSKERYLAWAAFISILIILPAGMSRSAWIAAALSAVFVFWKVRYGSKRVHAFIQQYKRYVVVGTAVSILLVGVVGMGLYSFKQQSADGRVLMWRVTTTALASNLLGGTGVGGFAAAYTESQANYLASPQATEADRLVAGSPEYAFNEFLQIGVEQGVVGLLLFILFLYSATRRALRNGAVGVAASIVALALFACSSYPLQLPSFWVLLIFLGAMAASDSPHPITSPNPKGTMQLPKGILVSLALVGCLLAVGHKKRYEAYQAWSRAQLLYQNRAYQVALKSYTELHPLLKHQPEFLFEQGQCLSKTGNYTQAIAVLHRAMQVSSDPMIRYMIAKNEQARGNYTQAEQELLYAIQILPERIYPYYLLAKLYAEPEFYNAKKFADAAYVVLNQKPKVHSTAILEMRREIEEMQREVEGR